METKLGPIRLCGDSVLLEPLEMRDLHALVSAASGGRSTFAFTTVPESEFEMKGYIETACQARDDRKAYAFVIRDRKKDRVVGSTRFGSLEFWTWPEGNPLQRPASIPDSVEIGWTWLSESVQRTQINTEMKLLMLTHAFETWKVHRVTLKTDVRNERSRRAILRIGAQFEGILRSHMPASDGSVRDTAIYSILREEWSLLKKSLEDKLSFPKLGLS